MDKRSVAGMAAVILLLIVLTGLWAGIRPMIVVSGSMGRALPAGSLCFIDTSYGDIRQGEIITFDFGKGKVTHRVVGVLQEGYVTKGDANGVQDFAPIRRHQVYGKLSAYIPYVGYGIAFVQKYGLPIIVAGMVCFFIKKRVMRERGKRLWLT
ncbi:MAG: signal peptidase I [Emergencia sp.]